MKRKKEDSKNEFDQKILVIIPGEGEVYVSRKALLGGLVILKPPKKNNNVFLKISPSQK